MGIDLHPYIMRPVLKTEGGEGLEEEEVPPAAELVLHFIRQPCTLDLGLAIATSSEIGTAAPLLPTNEVICMLDVEDVTTLEHYCYAEEEEENSSGGALHDEDRVLWSGKPNTRRLGLYMLLIWLQGIGMIALGHLLLEQICGVIGECYTYLSPGVYWAAMLLLLVCVARFADTDYFHGKIAAIENNVAFVLHTRSPGTTFFLMNGVHAKSYQQGIAPCPLTVLYCRWKYMSRRRVPPTTTTITACAHEGSSFIKVALFTLPQEQGLQIPVACDAIDALRASFLSTGMSFMNYHGILIINQKNLVEADTQQLMTFLFRSGFSILCNDNAAGLMVAMRRMGGYGAWKLHAVERQQQQIANVFVHCAAQELLSIRLRFVPVRMALTPPHCC
jgi:hypothetical protein